MVSLPGAIFMNHTLQFKTNKTQNKKQKKKQKNKINGNTKQKKHRLHPADSVVIASYIIIAVAQQNFFYENLSVITTLTYVATNW